MSYVLLQIKCCVSSCPLLNKSLYWPQLLEKTNGLWYINYMCWCCWHIRIDEIYVLTRKVKLQTCNFTLISFSGSNFTDDFVFANWFNCVSQNSLLQCVFVHIFFLCLVPRWFKNVRHRYTATHIHFYIMTNYLFINK